MNNSTVNKAYEKSPGSIKPILIQFIDHNAIENRHVFTAGKCKIFKFPRKHGSIAFILFIKLANPSEKKHHLNFPLRINFFTLKIKCL